jgi:hypothetical protein
VTGGTSAPPAPIPRTTPTPDTNKPAPKPLQSACPLSYRIMDLWLSDSMAEPHKPTGTSRACGPSEVVGMGKKGYTAGAE